MDAVRGILEQNLRPPPLPPDRDKTTCRNKEYRADAHSAFFSPNRAEHFCSSNRSIWVQKNEFYAYSKSEDQN